MPNLYVRRGAQTLVNTETTASQSQSNIAVLADGGFIIVWSDGSGAGGDASPASIKAQRYDADGNKVGGELLVNSVTAGSQGAATVAVLASGRFVVTWVDFNDFTTTDGTNFQIKARLFEADGTPVAAEFMVNDPTMDQLLFPAITELAGGGFVIAWTGTDGGGNGVRAQVYDADGIEVGGEFVVNTTTSGLQSTPSLTALAGGGFAAAWQGPAIITVVNGVSTTRQTVWTQVFDSSGAKVGVEQQVNTDTLGVHNSTSIAALDSGYVVAWAAGVTGAYPAGTNIKIQLFDGSGAKVGGEILVNTVTDGTQNTPHVDRLPGGGFVVFWRGPASSDGIGDVRAQVFDAAGTRIGLEFVVNSVTSGEQSVPKAVVLPSGEIAVTWTDNNGLDGDASSNAVKLQFLESTEAAPTDLALSNETVSETRIDGLTVATLTAAGALNTSFSYAIVSDASGGGFAIEGDRLLVADNSRLDFETQPSVDLVVRATDLNGQSYDETVTITVTDAAIESRYSAGDEFRVNTDTAGFNSVMSVTPLASGGFLVVTAHSLIGFGNGVRGQIYDAAGGPAGSEFDFDLSDRFDDGGPVAGFTAGGFVMVFEASNPAGDGTFLRAQRFDAAGAETGAEIDVALTPGSFVESSVAALHSGGFVVIWREWTDEGSTAFDPVESHIKARIIDSAGMPVGAAFQVNATADGLQQWPEIAALPGGGFVASWWDDPTATLNGRLFDAAGNALGNEFSIAPDAPASSLHDLLLLASGDILVTWAEIIDDTGEIPVYGIAGQLLDPTGTPIGGPIPLIAPATNYEHNVVALPDGGFALSWSLVNLSTLDEEDIDSWVQFFDGSANAVGDPFIVSEPSADGESAAAMAAFGSGDLAFVWTRGFVENGSATSDTYARIISPDAGIVGTPDPDSLTGTGNADVIRGLGAADTILGLGEDDIIDGGEGADSMTGGAGNDVYIVDNAGDAVIENSGEGTDEIRTTLASATLAGTHIENLAGLGAVDQQLTGNDGTNRISGGAGHDLISGAAGADVLRGGSGNDSLIGGAGADDMAGGEGNDAFFVDVQADIVTEGAGEGSADRVNAAVSYTLAAGVEVEVLSPVSTSGTTAIDLTGNEFANALIGNNGANVLDGAGAADNMTGRGGNDWYFVDSLADIAAENVDSAIGGTADRVFARVSYVLAAGTGIEILSTASNSGTDAIDLTGNELANALIGNAGANVLDGGGGIDNMAGRGGNDSYFVDHASDLVSEHADSAIGGSADRVFAHVSYALRAGAGIETLSTASDTGTTAINLTGNEFANALIGNAGVNILDGGGGVDEMTGLGGNDFYFVDTLADIAAENADSAIGGTADRVFARVSYALAAGTGIEILSTASNSGTIAIDLAGNELAQSILGNNGANVLNGKAGKDAINGLGGADIFVFDTALDTAPGAAWASFASTANVDKLSDFNVADDTIHLDDAIFAGLALGTLAAGAFNTGATATEADDRILYDSVTGALIFDPDGSAGSAQVFQFAVVAPGLVLTNADFFVI